jgi:hypothetical protein
MASVLSAPGYQLAIAPPAPPRRVPPSRNNWRSSGRASWAWTVSASTTTSSSWGVTRFAVRLLVEMERELGVEVPLASFLETFTVAGLAAIIEAMGGREGGVLRA